MRFRGPVERFDDDLGVVLGPAWRRDCGLAAGDAIDVVVEPEGPQRDDLAADFAAALEQTPKAGAFWDELANFYKKAYLRHIDATKRNPEKRVERIDEVVGLLAKGVKERG
jgi:uncharacterized protein YdeI (YjbR/CyaY-like superfamily)